MLSVVVLAAGIGRRFRSELPKLLHDAAGRPLLWHVLAATGELGADRVVVVVGRNGDKVRAAAEGFGLGPLRFAVQREPLGTGDALAAAVPELPGEGDVLVLLADTPLLRGATLAAVLEAHRSAGADATMLTAVVGDPTGYGRVLRDAAGRVTGVVEERDASPEQRAIREVNTGVIALRRGALAYLDRLGTDNDQGERYLPEVLSLLLEDGGRVAAVPGRAAEIEGVNDRAQLAAAAAALRRRALERLMRDGVTVIDPATTYVDVDVEVGAETVLEPLTLLRAGTRVGAGCGIGPNVRLEACLVGDGATVTQAVGVRARVGEGATVGPFAYLRPGADLAPGAKVGTYVEVKQARIGEGSKVPHLTYVGDADVGSGVNVGAGTVFVNYDGVDKHHTTVGDGAFIGSATMLVAPLRVGAGAQTAAGSTITKDVPPDALAVERSAQRNIAGYASRRRHEGGKATPGRH